MDFYRSVDVTAKMSPLKPVFLISNEKIGVSACSRKTLSSDFGVISVLALRIGLKTLHSDFRFTALVGDISEPLIQLRAAEEQLETSTS